MKKYFFLSFLIFNIFSLAYAGYIDDEFGVGPSRYLIDMFTYKNSASKQIDFLLNLSLSRANQADGTLGAGGTLYFNVSDPLTLSINYNYYSAKTYADYNAPTTVAYAGQVYNATLNEPIVQINNTIKGGIAYDLPFFDDYTPSVDYYLSLVPEKVYTNWDFNFQNDRGKNIEYDITYKSKTFLNTINDLSINTGLPFDFNTWLGGTIDLYDFNAKQIADITGASAQTKIAQALKSAVQFAKGTVYTGLSKKLSDWNMILTYTYTDYYYSYISTSNDFSHDFALSLGYSFEMKENLKSIDVALKYELLRAHYTDDTFLNSNYLYADVTLYLL